MIYFTKGKLKNHESKTIEQKIRSRTINYKSGLDLASPVLNIGSKKFFYGYQEEGDVEIVRTRSSLERFLPKIIVGFLDGDFCNSVLKNHLQSNPTKKTFRPYSLLD